MRSSQISSFPFRPGTEEAANIFFYILNMAKNTLKTLALALALFSLAGAKESKFTDKRDGKVYATTKIGKQVWMAENLNYATDSSWCYKDDPANCKKYGRLYTWNSAMKACPTGWHLPTSKEWDELEKTIGEKAGTKLKSTDWDGTDAVGFVALPAGYRNDKYVGFDGMGSCACFWTATDDYGAYNRNLVSGDTNLMSSGMESSDYSVRCVKD